MGSWAGVVGSLFFIIKDSAGGMAQVVESLLSKHRGPKLKGLVSPKINKLKKINKGYWWNNWQNLNKVFSLDNSNVIIEMLISVCFCFCFFGVVLEVKFRKLGLGYSLMVDGLLSMYQALNT
jgi:hypothetical protein